MNPLRPPDYFDTLYAANPDPWGFATSSYEAEKYAATLAALHGRHFNSALEVGCSIGVFTAMLAPFCGSLLAIDIADAALSQARARCAALPHVHIENRHIPQNWPAQKFDLIVIAEVLYFLSPNDIQQTAAKARNSLKAGGFILLVNYRGPIDEPCSGDEAADLFIATFGSNHRRVEARNQNFRIDILVNQGG
jgi:predicted TPR repeat methyltransferase